MGVSVGAGVLLGVGVGVLVGAGVNVLVGVGVGVSVGTGVGVGIGIAVGVLVGVAVLVGKDVAVGNGVEPGIEAIRTGVDVNTGTQADKTRLTNKKEINGCFIVRVSSCGGRCQPFIGWAAGFKEF